MLNPICNDCLQLNNGCSGTTCQAWTGCVYKRQDKTKEKMTYCRNNQLWNQNKKIKSKFTSIGYFGNHIYVGLLAPGRGKWTSQDYIDITSYFGCIGFRIISAEEAKKVSNIPIAGFARFLELEKPQ